MGYIISFHLTKMDLMDFRGPKGVKLSPLIVNRHRFQIKMALSICLYTEWTLFLIAVDRCMSTQLRNAALHGDQK